MSTPQPIAITRFRELWIHTGTTCNLSCPFCHEGSKPGDARLEAPLAAELVPVLDAAAARGVERFVFTGGEPLILRDIHTVLAEALRRRPALVLTNGTAPFIRRTHQLASLRELPHRLEFRVSIDHPDEARHDAGRGFRNFRKAMEGLRLLHTAGFPVGITRQISSGEDPAAVERRFRQLLGRQGLPGDLPIIALPDLGALGGAVPAAPGTVRGGADRPPPACAGGRMVMRRQGSLQLAPCPLVDDDPSFDMPADLSAALAAGIVPRHRRCSLCLGSGVDYPGISPPAGV